MEVFSISFAPSIVHAVAKFFRPMPQGTENKVGFLPVISPTPERPQDFDHDCLITVIKMRSQLVS